MTMSKPRLVRTGPGSAVAMVKSKSGPPLSLRSMPNTSQITPNSKGATPGQGEQDDLLEHAMSLSTALAGIDELCRSCQSWLSVVNRRFTAMEIMIAVLLVRPVAMRRSCDDSCAS